MKARTFNLFVLTLGLVLTTALLHGQATLTRARVPEPEGEGMHTAAEQPPRTMALVGQVGGPTSAVAQDGSYAYIAAGPRLTIRDVSDPTDLSPVGRTEVLPGIVRDVALSQDIAYVANGEGGLRVIDISIAAQPNEIGRYETPGAAQGVATAGQYVYVAESPRWEEEGGSWQLVGGGLRIFNVADPSMPLDVGFEDTDWRPHDVVLAHDHAYLAEQPVWDQELSDYVGGGVAVVDISEPTSPSTISAYETPGWASRITVADGYVYLADWPDLRVIDVSDPESLSEEGFWSTGGGVHDLVVLDNHAYVASPGVGLYILDVNDPAVPTPIGLAGMPGVAQTVAVADDCAYVGLRKGGLSIADVSDPEAPSDLGAYDTVGQALAVEVAGSHAYVADGGFTAVNISHPVHPGAVGDLKVPEWLDDVAVAGDYAFLAAGFHVVDISDPEALTEVASCDLPWRAQTVEVDGDYVYLTDEAVGLRVMDVSNPISPTEVVSCTTSGPAHDLAVEADYAYIADGESGLVVVDVSDPTSANSISVCPLPGSADGVAAAGRYAYVAGSAVWNPESESATGAGLHVIDVGERTDPMPVASIGSWSGVAVAPAGDIVFVAAKSAGLRVVDVSTPQAPREVGFYDTPGSARDVIVRGGNVYVADQDGGLFLLQLSPPPLYVDRESGEDTSTCGAFDAPCETISYTVNTRATAGSVVHVAQGVYTENLTVPLSLTLKGGYEPLNWTRDVTQHETIIDGSGSTDSEPVVTFADGSDGSVLDGFTVTGGDAERGAGLRIEDDVEVTVRNSTITGNTAADDGGGIMVGAGGGLRLESSKVTKNESTEACGGGIVVDDGATVVISDTLISTNVAAQRGGGLEAHRGGNVVEVYRGAIRDNRAAREGGGVSLDTDASVLISSTDVISNAAGESGGGVYLDEDVSLTIRSSRLFSNTADGGGGAIETTSDGPLLITDTHIYANTAIGSGAGIKTRCRGTLSLARSWVVANTSLDNDAGGVEVGGGGASYVENSIIAGNYAGDTAAGLYFGDGGPYRIVNSHIVGNHTPGEGAALETYRFAQVQVTNTLIISNTGLTGIDDKYGNGSVFLLSHCDTYGNSPDGTVGVTITRTDCLGTPAEDGVDPLMAGGALPGGAGPAFAAQWLSYAYELASGSPCIDAGTSADAPSIDIEEQPRPADGNLDGFPQWDIGAYEFQPRKVYLPLALKEVE